MKRDFGLPLVSLDGIPYTDGSTLKTVVFTAVTSPLPGDESQTADDKMKLYGLAQRAHKGGVIELTSEEVALIKARIGKAFAVLTVGAAFDLLEKDYQEPKDDA